MRIAANDTVELLAKKNACGLPVPDGATSSLLCYKQMIQPAALFPTLHRTNTDPSQSVYIQCYDHFRLSPPMYRRHGLIVRRHNIVSARFRLGYRPLWQVSEARNIPHFTSCKLYDCPNAKSLQHYCLQCPFRMW